MRESISIKPFSRLQEAYNEGDVKPLTDLLASTRIRSFCETKHETPVHHTDPDRCRRVQVMNQQQMAASFFADYF